MPSRMEQKESIELKRHSTQEKNKLKLKKNIICPYIVRLQIQQNKKKTIKVKQTIIDDLMK